MRAVPGRRWRLSAEHYVADTDALYANLESFNRWYDETWGFNYEDQHLRHRPAVACATSTAAVALTDEILEPRAQGRAAADRTRVRPLARRPVLRSDLVAAQRGRRHGRAPHHAVLVLRRDLARRGATDADPASWHMSAWQWMNVYGERPIIDTRLVAHLRQPLRPIPATCRCWSPSTARAGCRTCSRTWTRAGAWVATAPGSAASSTSGPAGSSSDFVRVAPYPEDDIPWIVENLEGDATCLVMGSDFPHAEGLAEPADFEKLLDPLDEPTKRAIMRGNAETLFSR